MIQITRLLAKQLRMVVRKLLGNHGPDLALRAGPFGLLVQACGFEQALEYHEPTSREPAEMTVPLAVLDDVQGTKPEPVTLAPFKKGVLAASWQERGVARTMQYAIPKAREDTFPQLPSSLAVNPPALLTALREACETTDQSSTRYALGCIQLRGKTGQIAATDGHQLLLQGGFDFGFEEELLAQRTTVFAGKELPADQSVQIGYTETHLVVRIGPWTFWLGLDKQGRFPRVENVIPTSETAKTTLELAPADAQFLCANIQRLPSSPEEPGATLDLNGSIVLRAKTFDTPQPVEIVLSNSVRSGDDVRLNIDQRFFVRAARMGFGRIDLYGPDAALLARDEQRIYLWMPLNSEGAIPVSNDCLRIESPIGDRFTASCFSPVPSTPVTMTTKLATSTPAAAPETIPTIQPPPVRRRCAGKAGGSALDQAITLRDQLRVTLTSTKELIRALKAEKRTQKSMKLALDSLKQLQQVA